MSKTISAWSPRRPHRLALALAGLGGFMTLSSLLLPGSPADMTVGANLTKENRGRENPMSPLQGTQAREYLQQHGEYDSLMQAATAERFGLNHYDRSPFGGETDGYLAMSHVQNLNAWFNDAGVTIRRTLPDEGRAKSWQMRMKLSAYGYGGKLREVPPVISHKVKDNWIEYERDNGRLPIADCRFEASSGLESQSLLNLKNEGHDSSLFQSAITNRKSAITEWYENRAAGIEQGLR
ncbi:MAG TPA: hypothetical protein VFD75_10300, partial [Pyrinomonadaceae bacterium]|nr:hypothetical protein [Pyrinomonadaceae bacterium]